MVLSDVWPTVVEKTFLQVYRNEKRPNFFKSIVNVLEDYLLIDIFIAAIEKFKIFLHLFHKEFAWVKYMMKVK